MAEKERYYFIFKYVDGSTQEFEMDNDRLSATIRNTGNSRITVDNVIINLENVIKVTIETESQRDEEKRLADEKTKANMNALSNLKF